jgi:hypothetical protein
VEEITSARMVAGARLWSRLVAVVVVIVAVSFRRVIPVRWRHMGETVIPGGSYQQLLGAHSTPHARRRPVRPRGRVLQIMTTVTAEPRHRH